MIILGAGLSGLIAAALNPQAKVFEAASQDAQSHRAVLRFRTSAVGDAVGIPFRKIRVNKGIWFEGQFCFPDIQLSNMYSYKVTGGYFDRSIWKVDAVDRFIAPEDFILRLIEQVGDRVSWNSPVTELPEARPILSTIPMNRVLDLAKLETTDRPEFKFSPIRVQRFRIPRSDVFQTIYYPSPMTAAYRASITGDLLIVESVDDPAYDPVDMDEILRSFGILIGHAPIKAIDITHKQSYGKIAPIDEQFRRFVVEHLSQKHSIYSLGRFATWRNILLDDVLQDLNVIKKLMNADAYTRKLASSKA
jgi:hypothetical protein